MLDGHVLFMGDLVANWVVTVVLRRARVVVGLGGGCVVNPVRVSSGIGVVVAITMGADVTVESTEGSLVPVVEAVRGAVVVVVVVVVVPGAGVVVGVVVVVVVVEVVVVGAV